MELDSCWEEGCGNFLVDIKSGLDEWLDELGAVGAKLVERQMLLEDLLVDGFQSVHTRERNGENREMSLESGVDSERTGSRVHARDVLTVVDFLQR